MSSAPRPAVFAPSASVPAEAFCAPSRAAARKSGGGTARSAASGAPAGAASAMFRPAATTADVTPFPAPAAATATYDATFTAVVAPSSGVGRTVILQIPEQGSVTWSIPDALTFGKHYTYWGEIDGSAFKVTSSNITAWTDNAETEIAGDLAARIQGNNRITWDAADSHYVLTTDPTDAGLYFRFGGVAGIYSASDGGNQALPGTNSDPFGPEDVAWSPVEITGTEAAGWATVPVYDGTTDFLLNPNSITPPLYHNAANVKAGKGDPCRLVGLDLAYIAATDAGALTAADIDNGKWRLPIVAEIRPTPAATPTAPTPPTGELKAA